MNESRLLGFRQTDILPPMAGNLCLEDPRTIKKINDTLHAIFVKHEMYQKIHYIHVQYIYPLPTHVAQAFGNYMN